MVLRLPAVRDAHRAVFGGETLSDTIANVLDRQPDWAALPAATPPAIRKLLRRCLNREPRERLRDIGDARADLRDALREPDTIAATAPQRARRVDVLPWAVSVALAAAIGGVGTWLLASRSDTPSRGTAIGFEIAGLLPTG